jgi:hypothetical protein
MSTNIFHSPFGRASVFLLVRTHSQMQYYLNLSNTRRAANDGGLAASSVRRCGNVVEIHPLSHGSLAR